MLLESLILPSQAMIPLGIALAHLALGLFLIFNQRHNSNILIHILIAYILITTLWNINLVAIVGYVPMPIPGITWVNFMPHGFIILGVLYWAFGRAYLHKSWKAPWGWAIGLVGFILIVSLNMRWIPLPAHFFAWSTGWIYAENIGFILGVVWWAFFMGLTLVTVGLRQYRTQNPAHKNRIQYLAITTTSLLVGYGIYLLFLESFWAVGLIITWIGSALTTYIVVIEDLMDLATAVRRTIHLLTMALVTIVVYICGIYLVQIFLGEFIASTMLARFFNQNLLVAAVTAVLLTIVYTPIQRLVRRYTNRILYGRRYSYQTVIRNYTQTVSNILYLDELVNVALTLIKQTLKIEKGILLMLDSETSDQFLFRILPNQTSYNFPKTIALTKVTPVTNRLIDKKSALAQYSVDISRQFKGMPDEDRQALKSLNFEWFIPIFKKEQLIGIFAFGTKLTKRRYTAQDIRLLTTLADQTALALENASLVDKLQRNLVETTRMKNLMDNVFDSMDNGVVTTDLVGRITLFNKAAESILALPSNRNIIGRLYTQVIPSLTNTIFPNLVTNVIERENHYVDYEIISEIPDRGRISLNMNLAPLKDADNQTHGVTMVMDDMTDTKRLEAVQDMFRRYVSPAVVDRLPSDPSKLELGGLRQQVTILFADIRGFTSFSEKLEPEKLVDTLNEYLSMAATSILMYEGTLDKFMGDAVMGIFNAPLEQEDHVLRAVRAAIAMQRTIADYHRNLGQKQCLSFGVGLHTGEAVVGNVGMSDRMDYTAIGDTVNLAKRIQESTPGGKILVSDTVYDIVKDSVKALFHKEMNVKGREQSVSTYELQLM